MMTSPLVAEIQKQLQQFSVHWQPKPKLSAIGGEALEALKKIGYVEQRVDVRATNAATKETYLFKVRSGWVARQSVEDEIRAKLPANWKGHVTLNWLTEAGEVRLTTKGDLTKRGELLSPEQHSTETFTAAIESMHLERPDQWLGPFRSKVVRVLFGLEEKSWTDFANRYRAQDKIKNSIGGGAKSVMIRESVFIENGIEPPR